MNVRMTIRPMILALAGSGMIMLNGSTAYAATTVTAATDSSAQSAVNIGEVSRGNIYATAKESKQKKKLHSTLHVVHISKKQIDNSVPPGGSIAFALKNVPGVQVQGYGGTAGAQRNEIRLNGVTAGWTAAGGNPERDALQFNFDGIPMNDPYADWEGFETSTVPISAIFSGIEVTQGPGNPASRYYDSLGGTINLIPWAPSSRPSAQVSIGGGSFNSYNASAVLQTGDIDGWKTVLAGGYTHSGSFLHSTGNYTGSSEGSAVYIKTKRNILNNDGTFSIAGYFSNIEEYRPEPIPVYNQSGITTKGANVAGGYYSQQAQGYYYALPNNIYFKNVQGHVYMIWSRLMEHLTNNLQVTNTVYYRFGHRIHDRIRDYSFDNYAEYYHVDRSTFGDRLAFNYHLKNNLIKFGLSYITMRTKHDQQGYSVNPPLGGESDPTYIRDLLYNWEDFSPYIQDNISLLNGNLTIVPGLMLENYNYRWIDNSASTIPVGDPYLSPTGPTQIVPSDLGNTTGLFLEPNKHVIYNNIEPSIGLNLKIIKHLAAYFTWAVHHTTPQEGAFWSGEADEVPLQPVSVQSYIGGIRYLNGPISASVSGFRQHFKNQYLLTQSPFNPLVTNLSKLTATYNGINLSLGYHPQEGFDALVNATFQHDYYNKFIGSNGTAYYGDPISNVPSFMLNLSVGYGWFSNQTAWRINLNDNYDSSIYLPNENDGLPTRERWGGHNVLGLFASARTAMFNAYMPDLKYLKFTLSIDNLLDRKYESDILLGSLTADSPLTYLALAGAPLSVYGSVTADF